MAVCSNSLIILRMVNEEVFHGKEEITTVKRNILKDAVRQEYSKIFSLIQNILEYSENADVDNALLVNCFSCLISYCRDMDPQYIFSTRIVEMIIAHLNSAHAVLVLRSLLSICDLFEPLEITEKLDERTLNIPQGLNKETVFAKINLIHRELIMFFKTYLGKFSPDSSLEKEYSLFSDEEKSFIKQITQLFVSIYKNYHPYIPDSILIESLEQFIEISKINDLQLFKETLNGWEILIYDFYIEYPIRPVPDGKIRRFKFKTILQRMINVFVKFMPKPEKVFVTLNEFQEAVKVKEFTTEEMVFSKRMNQTFFNLTFCIDNHVKDFFLVTFNRIGSNSEKFDPVYLNKVCWVYGSTAGAFESDVEERIFMIACKSLMSLCSIILHR
ncbi:XPO1, partial [Hepatospora eriocheir]